MMTRTHTYTSALTCADTKTFTTTSTDVNAQMTNTVQDTLTPPAEYKDALLKLYL